MHDRAMTDDLALDLDRLRGLTPGCANRVHLNNAGAGLLTRTTIDAMTAHLRLESEIGGYEAAAAAQERIEGAYTALGTLVGARRHEIALFDNSSHAWNAAFYSIPLAPGDRILTGRDEYGSNVLAYLQVAARTGAEVVVVPDDESGQIDLDALRELADERVKVIGLTWVPTAGGLVNPAAEVGRIAADTGALYLVDATQAVGQFPVDVDAIGCDLLTGTGRKFLRGPRGTGFLYVRESVLDRLDPHVAEIASATWDGARSFTWAEGARRFESWENSYVNVVGLASAVEQALEVGLDRVGERSRRLGAALRDQLAALPGVTVHDLGREKCAIVTAKVAGHDAADVADALVGKGVNVSYTVDRHTPFDTEARAVHPLVRFSPHYYNTDDEITRAVEAVAALS
jgi:selenocysteine lyase/cysteine desulfurase